MKTKKKAKELKRGDVVTCLTPNDAKPGRYEVEDVDHEERVVMVTFKADSGDLHKIGYAPESHVPLEVTP